MSYAHGQFCAQGTICCFASSYQCHFVRRLAMSFCKRKSMFFAQGNLCCLLTVTNVVLQMMVNVVLPSTISVVLAVPVVLFQTSVICIGVLGFLKSDCGIDRNKNEFLTSNVGRPQQIRRVRLFCCCSVLVDYWEWYFSWNAYKLADQHEWTNGENLTYLQ